MKKKEWKIEIFKDKDTAYRIRLRASNGKIIMSSEAYSSSKKAFQTAEQILRNIPNKITFEAD